MASLDLATLMVRIEADISNALQGMEQVGEQSQQQAERTTTNWEKAGKALTDIGGSLTKAITVPLTAAATACVKLASDLTETLGKTEVVFGELSDTVIAWSETAVENMGLAQQTALDMASTYGDLGTSMGLTTNEAANMSMELVQLAADMASFKNISVERANTALQAVYTGETESLKAMGIVMTEANLNAFAMNEGLDTTYNKMSQTEKVMLRYKYVMAQTTNAQGDFVRTGDSLANQSRKLVQNLKELGASFGKILEPAITSIVSTLNNVVSWFRNLDDGWKRVIITIGEVAAVIPVVVLAIGTIITAVHTLSGALTTLLANPVVLTITGIIAALTTLAIVVGNVSGAIGEYNQKVAEMKDKETTVKTNYEALVQVSEDEENNVDTVLTNIETAISTAESAGELIASIEAVEDKDRTVDDVISAIDAALAAKELECKIAGKKKENDTVWQELEQIKSGLIDGTITIYGSDGNGTLTKVRDLIVDTENSLTALKAYEQAVIKPQVAFDTTTAQERAENLYNKCAEIAGIDTSIDFSFSVSNLGSTEGGDGVLGAMAKAIASTKDWSGQLEELGSSFDDLIEQQKEYLLSISASQVVSAFQAYNSGKITFEELEATCRAANEQYLVLSGNLDTSSDAFNNLKETLNNGDPSDDMEAWATFGEAVADLSVGMTETETSAEKVATATGRISESLQAGATDTEAMTGDVTLLNSGLTDLGDGMENDVCSAYDTYNTSMENIQSTEEAGRNSIDENITKLQEQQLALSTYATFLDENNGNYTAAMEALNAFSQGEGQIVIDYYNGMDTVTATSSKKMRDDAYTLGVEIVELQQTQEADKQAITDEANAKREEASKTLFEDLSTITSGYSTEELLATAELCNKVGNTEGASQVNRIIGLQGYCDTAKAMTEANCNDVVALNETCLGEVVGLAPTAKDGGDSVGSNLGEGIYNGLGGWQEAINDKAKDIIKTAIKAAQQESDSHSPSRKTKKLIGIPFAQGIETGIEEYMPKLLKSTKKNIGSIITAGTGVINSDYKVRPNAITNVGRQGNTTINQTNNFTSRTLSPYEQQQQVRKMNKQLAEVYV